MEHEDPKLNRLLRIFEEANRDTVTTDELATVVEGITKAFEGHCDYVEKEIEELEQLVSGVKANLERDITYVSGQTNENSSDILALQLGLKNLVDKVKSLPNQSEVLEEVDKRLLDTLKTWDVSDIKKSVVDEVSQNLPNDKSFIETLEKNLTKLTGDELVELISKATKKISAQNIKDLPEPQTVVYSSSTQQGTGGSDIIIKDEGINVSTTPASIDFVGAGVSVSAIGNDVTVTFTGGGGGGATLTKQTVTGTVDDSNTTFTVAIEPLYIVVNGSQYSEGEGAYTSYSAGTITLAYPVGTGGFITSYYNA